MTISRRGFLSAILAAAAAPAFVRASSLSPIVVPRSDFTFVSARTHSPALLARLGADFDGDLVSTAFLTLMTTELNLFSDKNGGFRNNLFNGHTSEIILPTIAAMPRSGRSRTLHLNQT